MRAELAAFPEGGAIEDLGARLTGLVSRRSLQGKLPDWVANGEICAEGFTTGGGTSFLYAEAMNHEYLQSAPLLIQVAPPVAVVHALFPNYSYQVFHD